MRSIHLYYFTPLMVFLQGTILYFQRYENADLASQVVNIDEYITSTIVKPFVNESNRIMLRCLSYEVSETVFCVELDYSLMLLAR